MIAISVEQGYDLNSGCSFTDGGGNECRALDVVQYKEGQRRGILLDVTSDGDAYVLFRDTRKVTIVKWRLLCKVPEFESLPD